MGPRTAAAPLLVALVCLTAGCTSPAPEPVDEAAEREALAAAMEGFGEAVVAGDMDAAAAFMTEDFELREPGMNLDKAGWREMVNGVLASGGGVESFETRTEDHFLHGDVAYEVGEYDETVVMGGARQNIEGYYFVRWEKGGDGVWRMDRLVAGPRAAPMPAPEM